MNPLTSIPARVRLVMYWVAYVLNSATDLATLVWVSVAAASPDVKQPLWLIIGTVVFHFITNQLNLLAGSNVTRADPSEPEYEYDHEYDPEPETDLSDAIQSFHGGTGDSYA